MFNLRENKPLIALVFIIIIMLIVLLFINVSNSNRSNTNNKTNKNIKYKEVTDSAEDILSLVYNKNSDYYTGFYDENLKQENIFGNEKQVYVHDFSSKTKLTLALNTFNVSNMKKVDCKTIDWNGNSNLKCGSNLENIAYYIPVQEINKKVEEMFNERIDYSNLDLDNLTIGVCTGNNSNNYIFKYIKNRSIYVSAKRDKSCVNNGKLEVTEVEKNQDKDILTLTVSYNKAKAYTSNNSLYYGDSESHKDKFFFKVDENGKYYFLRSTLFDNESN